MSPEAITVVVRRRVLPGHEQDFEAAMREFIAFAISHPGHVDIHVLRPGGPAQRDYTVIDRFASAESRESFKRSAAYQKWMQRLGALTEGEPHIEEMGGLAGWFTLPERSIPHPPPRPKMAAITFLAVYPLTSILPSAVAALLPDVPPLLRNVIVTGLVVSLLTWVIMPRLTRLFAGWLFPPAE